METKDTPETEPFDPVAFIMDYESGELEALPMVEGFAAFVRNGMAWSLQGHYGRTAKHLIDIAVLDREGNVDYDVLSELLTNQED